MKMPFYFILFYFLFYTLPLSISGNSGRLATAAARAALPNPTSACWVFSCFRNPPGTLTDIDYRIFNVRTIGHTDNLSGQHFDWEKLTHLSCASLTGLTHSNLGSLDLESDTDSTRNCGAQVYVYYKRRRKHISEIASSVDATAQVVPLTVDPGARAAPDLGVTSLYGLVRTL